LEEYANIRGKRLRQMGFGATEKWPHGTGKPPEAITRVGQEKMK